MKRTFCPTVPLYHTLTGRCYQIAKAKSDRMVVVVSDKDVEKWLGVLRLSNVSRARIGHNMVHFLQEWTDFGPPSPLFVSIRRRVALESTEEL